MNQRALERLHKRRRALKRRRIQAATLGWIMAALVLLAAAGVLADRLMDPAAFPIREVSFEGHFKHLKPAVLRRTVMKAVNANYFGIDLEHVERAVESLDWVRRAQVRRVWPDGLHITVEEQHLVARWNTDAWLNDNGQVVKVATADEPQLLRLSGPEGTAREVLQRARRWSPRLERVGLVLKALMLNDRLAWYAVVARSDSQSVFSVALGRDGVPDRFTRFVEAFRALPADKVSLIDHVDARYPNGIALRLKQPVNSKDSA